jgi:hypothetical protein
MKKTQWWLVVELQWAAILIIVGPILFLFSLRSQIYWAKRFLLLIASNMRDFLIRSWLAVVFKIRWRAACLRCYASLYWGRPFSWSRASINHFTHSLKLSLAVPICEHSSRKILLFYAISILAWFTYTLREKGIDVFFVKVELIKVES